LCLTGWQSKNRGSLVNLEIRRHHTHHGVIQPVQRDPLSDSAAIAREISLPKSVAQHRDTVSPGRFIVRDEGSTQKGLNSEY
jgi:hypothetical protein